MSHIAREAVQIGQVDEDVLRETLERVASVEQGAEITDSMLDYYNNPIKVDAAIKTSKVTRGIGLRWRGQAQLQLEGDNWGYTDAYKELREEIVQVYQVIAATRALQDLGYFVPAPTGIPGTKKLALEAAHA